MPSIRPDLPSRPRAIWRRWPVLILLLAWTALLGLLILAPLWSVSIPLLESGPTAPAVLITWLSGSALLLAIVAHWRRRRDHMAELARHWAARAEQYRLIVDASEDWEYLQGSDGRLLYISPSCERITGYRAEEYIDDPKLLLRIVYPEDRERFARHLCSHGIHCPDAEPPAHRPLQAPERAIDFRILTRDGQTRWIAHRCRHARIPGQLSLGHRASNRDISFRKDAEQRLRQASRMLESIRVAQTLYLTQTPTREVFRQLLDTLVAVTDSEYGFLDEVITDASGTYKLNLALSDISWDEASAQLYRQLIDRQFEFRNLDNLAGAPVTTGSSIIANDPPHDPRSGGLPPGHPPILKYLGLPLYHGGELVGVAGIANRSEGYDADLAVWLEPFIGSCAAIIQATRLERQRQETLEHLEQANQHNRALLEASLDPMVVIDAQGRITDANRATERATGMPREVLLGTDFSDYFSDPERAREAYRTAFQRGEVRDFALDLRHRDGPAMPVLYNASVYRDAGGAVQQVFAAAREITQIKRFTDLLAARLRILESFDSRTLEQVLRASTDEAAALTGSLIGFYHFVEDDQEHLTLQTWSTRTLNEFCQADSSGLHYALAEAGVWADCVRERRAIIHNDYAALPHRRGLPEGHANVVRELVVPVFRERRIVAVLGVGNKPTDYDQEDLEIATAFADLAWDLAERKRLQKTLRENEARFRQMAHFDPLTELPNRVLLADRLHIALAEARREQRLLAVCYLDLDGFKPVNDTHGHDAGDLLLRAVAERLSHCLREEDTVARLGGDEFVLLLGRLASVEECRQTLGRVLAALGKPYDIGLPVPVDGISASIGVTLYPQDATDPDSLLRHADFAMYQAKQAGRNRFHFYG